MATNQVKKRGKNYFYHLCIQGIRETGKLPSCKSKQSWYYYTKPLQDSKLIEYIGLGVWKLTDLYKRLERQGLVKISNLHTLVKPNTSRRIKNKNIRGHGFGFTLRLPKISNWRNRYSIIKSYELPLEKLYNGNPKLILDGNKTHINAKTIVMYFDSDYSFVSDSAQDSFRQAINYFLKKIQFLENRLQISFKVRGKYKFKCFKHHFGNLDNIIAQKCKIDGKSYQIRREDGSLWLIIDFSNKIAETETVDKDTAVYDMDAKIKPLFDEVDRNPHFMRDAKEQIKELTIMVGELARTNKKLVAYLQKEKGLNTSDFIY